MDEEIKMKIIEIEDKINYLNKQKKELLLNEKEKKNNIQKQKVNNGKGNSNFLRRISYKLYKRYNQINEDRLKLCRETKNFEEYDTFSLPEFTYLIVDHKYWKDIEEDIIHYNKKLGKNGVKND